jgi:hypothetical protein
MPPPGLSGRAVEAVIAAKRPTVQATCAPSPCRSASAMLTLEIDPAGRVSSATSSGDAVVGACLVRLAKTWKFPASSGSGNFAIPYIFKC